MCYIIQQLTIFRLQEEQDHDVVFQIAQVPTAVVIYNGVFFVYDFICNKKLTSRAHKNQNCQNRTSIREMHK